MTPEPCTLPGYGGPLRCATVVVPEDRTRPGGRTVALRVVVVPATGDAPAPDPIFYFTGGPGQAATDGLPGTASELATGRARRALVLIDQRGTGASQPLRCGFGGMEATLASFLTGAFPVDSLRACRARFRAQGIDLARYGTADAVEDVEAVRRALGYDRINLFGVSYGTRVVVEYTRRYPTHARTATARGLYAPDARFPLAVARDAQRALDLTLAACDAAPACRATYPAARDDVTVALARARTRPARLPLGGPRAGADSVTLDAELLGGTLLFALYGADGAAAVPNDARTAARGDPAPLATPGLLTAYWASQTLASGMYLSVVCGEDVPRIASGDVARETAETFLGDLLVRNLRVACAEWLPGAVAPALAPLRSPVPMLVLTGEADPVTPPRWGEALLRGFARGRQVVLAATGHVPSMPACAVRLFGQFLETADAARLDAACAARSTWPAFAGVARADTGPAARPDARAPIAANVDGTWDLLWKTAKGTSPSGYLVIHQRGTTLVGEVHGNGELEATGTLAGDEVVLTGRKIASFEIRARARGDTLTGSLKVMSVERFFTGVRRP